MNIFHQQLVDDHAEMETKLATLQSFIVSDAFEYTLNAEQGRLVLQHHIMTAYALVLEQRIAARDSRATTKEGLIEPHPPAHDCDCRACACHERDRLRVALAAANSHAENFERLWYLRGDALDAAVPAMREYARLNPIHHSGETPQDPNGAHAWLRDFDV